MKLSEHNSTPRLWCILERRLRWWLRQLHHKRQRYIVDLWYPPCPSLYPMSFGASSVQGWRCYSQLNVGGKREGEVRPNKKCKKKKSRYVLATRQWLIVELQLWRGKTPEVYNAQLLASTQTDIGPLELRYCL